MNQNIDRFGQNVSSGDRDRADADVQKVQVDPQELEVIETVNVSEEEKRALEGGPALMDPRDLAFASEPVDLNDEPANG